MDSICEFINLKEIKVVNFKDTILISEYIYKNYMDTLSEYILYFDIEGNDHIGLIKYFEPLKHGLCLFWNENKKLIRNEFWEEGILIKTEDLK